MWHWSGVNPHPFPPHMFVLECLWRVLGPLLQSSVREGHNTTTEPTGQLEGLACPNAFPIYSQCVRQLPQLPGPRSGQSVRWRYHGYDSCTGLRLLSALGPWAALHPPANIFSGPRINQGTRIHIHTQTDTYRQPHVRLGRGTCNNPWPGRFNGNCADLVFDCDFDPLDFPKGRSLCSGNLSSHSTSLSVRKLVWLWEGSPELNP